MSSLHTLWPLGPDGAAWQNLLLASDSVQIPLAPLIHKEARTVFLLGSKVGKGIDFQQGGRGGGKETGTNLSKELVGWLVL